MRGSNSIEGIRVSEDEAFAIVGNEDDQVSIDETWLAVKGYSDAMTYLQTVAERSAQPLDESTLLAVHFMVQGYNLSRRPGRYREHEVFVRDDDAERTVCTGPDPAEVPELMQEYIEDLTSLADQRLHPMIQGAMAHLNLVMIDPFSDGNGRMSRIIQSLMLYREQVAEAEFVSIEEYLGWNTTAYYYILARVGGGRWSPLRDASEWVEFVLTVHYRQARTVQRRIWVLDRVAESVDDLVEKGLAQPVPLPRWSWPSPAGASATPPAERSPRSVRARRPVSWAPWASRGAAAPSSEEGHLVQPIRCPSRADGRAPGTGGRALRCRRRPVPARTSWRTGTRLR